MGRNVRELAYFAFLADGPFASVVTLARRSSLAI